jgi:hypothetical protein
MLKMTTFLVGLKSMKLVRFFLTLFIDTISVAEPEPPEPYNFDPRRTGIVSLL